MQKIERIVQKASKAIASHKYQEALELLKPHLTPPNKKVLQTYIEAQIKLGLYNDAMESLNLLINAFPDVYAKNQFGLAVIYAKCHQDKLLIDLLSKNMGGLSFGESRYLLARICYRNSMYKIAEFLFLTLLEAENISWRESSKEHLKKLDTLKKNPDTFLEKGYNSFKYKGYKLQPGHIITVNTIRKEYEENQNKSKRRNHATKIRYMIWKIKDEIIYAFPITTTTLESQHKIPKENYPLADRDRYLEPSIYCINTNDIDTVVGKIHDDDIDKAIDTMYKNICINYLGEWPKEIECFMNIMSTTRKILPFSVIIVRNPLPKFYCIWGIDEHNQQYQAFEVNSEFMPVDNKLKIINISTSTPILAVLYPNDSTDKGTIKPAPSKKRTV